MATTVTAATAMASKQMAINLFNETWELLLKPERSADGDALMLHKAHASCYLWSLEGNPVNDARGEWQVARVYTALGMGDAALLHARRSLDLCLDNGIGDFDLAFGYEGVARACALIGDTEQAEEYRDRALEAAEEVEEEDDHEYVVREIGTIALPA